MNWAQRSPKSELRGLGKLGMDPKKNDSPLPSIDSVLLVQLHIISILDSSTGMSYLQHQISGYESEISFSVRCANSP